MGSSDALVRIDWPSLARSVTGDMQTGAAGHASPASRGIAGDNDGLVCDALASQPAIARDAILDGSGKGMFGRQSIVDGERARPGGAAEPRDEVTVGRRRS